MYGCVRTGEFFANAGIRAMILRSAACIAFRLNGNCRDLSSGKPYRYCNQYGFVFDFEYRLILSMFYD